MRVSPPMLVLEIAVLNERAPVALSLQGSRASGRLQLPQEIPPAILVLRAVHRWESTKNAFERYRFIWMEGNVASGVYGVVIAPCVEDVEPSTTICVCACGSRSPPSHKLFLDLHCPDGKTSTRSLLCSHSAFPAASFPRTKKLLLMTG